MELSVFCGLNKLHVTQTLKCYIQLSQTFENQGNYYYFIFFLFTRKGVVLIYNVVFIVSYNKNILFKPICLLLLFS